MYVCVYVCTYVCMYVFMYVCMYLCMYICMYVCMYVYMYVCALALYHISHASCQIFHCYRCQNNSQTNCSHGRHVFTIHQSWTCTSWPQCRSQPTNSPPPTILLLLNIQNYRAQYSLDVTDWLRAVNTFTNFGITNSKSHLQRKTTMRLQQHKKCEQQKYRVTSIKVQGTIVCC